MSPFPMTHSIPTAFVIVALVAGCATNGIDTEVDSADYEDAMQTQHVILISTLEPSNDVVVATRSNSPLGEICVSVSQRSFAAPGIYSEELSRFLASNLEFIVDNHVIPHTALQIIQPLFLGGLLVEDGATVGGYAVPLEICHSTYSLNLGRHTATVNVRGPTGASLSYYWEFTITPNIDRQQPTTD